MSRSVVDGVSGSGKDYLLARIEGRLTSAGFRQVNFGEELARHAANGAYSDRDALRTAPAAYLNALVAEAMAELAGEEGVVLNTHVVYLWGDQYVFDPGPLSAFRPTNFSFVEADSNIIVARRTMDTSRQRPNETAAQVQLHQQVGAAAAAALAEYTSATFTRIDNTIDGAPEFTLDALYRSVTGEE